MASEETENLSSLRFTAQLAGVRLTVLGLGERYTDYSDKIRHYHKCLQTMIPSPIGTRGRGGTKGIRGRGGTGGDDEAVRRKSYSNSKSDSHKDTDTDADTDADTDISTDDDEDILLEDDVLILLDAYDVLLLPSVRTAGQVNMISQNAVPVLKFIDVMPFLSHFTNY